jgi:recombination protein RecT
METKDEGSRSMTESVGTALAKKDTGPEAMIKEYRSDFATVLPSHIKPDTWVRLAQGLLRRDKKLATAAANNPGSFLSALLECARLGLEPGDTFHLVPFGNQITGITDYTGEIELIYRAQAVASIKAEVVYSNDTFDYSPDMDRPKHKADWFGDRGKMIGAYAYGIFKDGATSRVVVMNKTQIDQVKAVSKTANQADSPWNKWPDRMWLKTVVKQLAKWVPSSPEYLEHALRAAQAAEHVPAGIRAEPVDVSHLEEMRPDDPDLTVDAEMVEE